VELDEELERLGPENVRVRATQHHGGSAGAIGGLGSEIQITKGFVEDWLVEATRRALDDSSETDQLTTENDQWRPAR
jgi:hypothetical protein